MGTPKQYILPGFKLKDKKMNTELNNYKERVKRLRKAVSSVLNVECSQSQAYELIAKEENYPNWDALSGSINKNSKELNSPTLTNKEQITQLFLLYEGLKYGCAFYDVLNILKEQSNPIIKKGWSNVESSTEYNKIIEAFEKTNFFNEEVLTLIKISLMSSEIESGIKSSIEFLKIA